MTLRLVIALLVVALVARKLLPRRRLPWLVPLVMVVVVVGVRTLVWLLGEE
ncbi:MAG TPA: hypothetical protein VNA30_05145 [Mycobacteriales bacterium]|nr:hypothetical protein [Mycobacteriales bacterium]